MSQQHDAPSSSTVVFPPQEPIAMTRESTLAPTTTLKDEPSSSRLENIRTKLSPLLLYVVSTAQFLDIVNGASVAVALLPIAEDLEFKAAEALWIHHHLCGPPPRLGPAR
ncbi:hypothetical protein BG000_003385 [Podila horticola]|nr:hypothetical protein BG000_003385 [Podila horticola]